jgi:hypothetical protein
MAESADNLAFIPRPITAVSLRPHGAQVQIAQPIIQRTAALRAYNAFSSGRDWMEKISSAYIVALGTRSADAYLMTSIQTAIPESPLFKCAKCREATIGIQVIRSTLFPKLDSLRKHANDLIHHLDNPENRGVATLNVQGVFDYCYHLFEEQAHLLFGDLSQSSFEFRACKDHR